MEIQKQNTENLMEIVKKKKKSSYNNNSKTVNIACKFNYIHLTIPTQIIK